MAASSPNSTNSNSSTNINTQPTSPILRISPQTFQFTASKVSSGLVSKLKIKNLLPTPVGYKFKTNAPLRYSVKPVLGVLVPGQSIEVFVRCESWVNPQDRFLLQSVSLAEEESHIDATTWKELDRRRIIETFIQCSSSSTLAMREPQDDGGSISSTSSNSSTHSSVVSSTRSSSGLSDKSRQARSQQQQADRSTDRKPVSTNLGRKMSSSSATSSNSSSPGSYPTLFQAKQPANTTKTEAKSRDLKEKEPGSTHAPLALFAAPVHYLHTRVSDSRQTLRTLTRFLAVRQYTKMQVFTVSMVCLLLGLLLPMEKLVMLGGSQTSHVTTSTSGIPKAFSGASSSASSSSLPSQKPAMIVIPVTQRPKVAPLLEEEAVSAAAYLPKVEDLLVEDGPSPQEEPVGAM
ncbi:Motile sperm domain-containing protein 2 [Podila clonocystis]|nr:Motile sperm domain-containing protein 2 [Podila clonocystis]